MKNLIMLCTAVSMALCGITPLQATGNANLEQAVSKGVTVQTLKSGESDRLAREMLYNLIKAHNGNVKEALEEFAGAPIFQDPFSLAGDSFAQVHAIYMSPEDLNTLWVVYATLQGRPYFSQYVMGLGKIKRNGKGIRYVSSYSFKDKTLLFTDLEPQMDDGYFSHREAINHWWEHKDDCPTANIGTLIAWDLEPGSTLPEMKEKLDDFAACNPNTLYSVYLVRKDPQHLYVITGDDYQVRMTDYYVGDPTRGGQHIYWQPKNINEPRWKKKAIKRFIVLARYWAGRVVWEQPQSAMQ